jgi:hypothetical protein
MREFIYGVRYFGEACLKACQHVPLKNKQIREQLDTALRSPDVGTPVQWDMLDEKLFRPRPRLCGAIGVYAMLSGLTIDQIMQNGGLPPFLLMWALGSCQDDYIDKIRAAELTGLTKMQRTRKIANTIFGREQTLFRRCYAMIIEYLNDQNFPLDEASYLRGKLANWYHFLYKQEEQMFGLNPNQVDFDICSEYRIQQNTRIGELLTALLNGINCLDPRLGILENAVPPFSILTQIIDDVADTREDLENGRPSFMVGALNEHPQERRRVEDFLSQHPLIVKIRPNVLGQLAPQSYHLVKEAYNKIALDISKQSPRAEVVRLAAKPLFHFFPLYRDMMYRINPRYANF